MLTLIHGTIGTVALVSCVLILILNKLNRPLHVTIGYVFCVTTILVSLVGIYIAIMKDMPVLVGIGIATILQVLLGIRALYNKHYINNIYDYLLTLLFICNLVFLLYAGTNIALAVCAVYSLVIAVHIFNTFIKKNKEKTLFLAQHISHMLGAATSVITAVIIGALGSFNIYWVFWILPSLVFILIVRYFRLKYAPIRAWNLKVIKW